jgi:hypothetical protein
VEFKIDDIFAAFMSVLIMMRRIEIKAADATQNPSVPAERFEAWKALALRAHNQGAIACFAKVVLSQACYQLGMNLRVDVFWRPILGELRVFQLGAFLIFVGWTIALIWAWKIGTDARHMRLSLGIQLRRRASPT